jgi:hypothetical protein
VIPNARTRLMPCAPSARRLQRDFTSGRTMIDTSDGSKAMDYPEHLRTYSGFIKGAVVLCVLVTLLLVFMLVTLV